MWRDDWAMSAADGSELYVRQWLPEAAPPRAAICLVHGHGEHGERYAGMASRLTDAGYAVLSWDQRGHGRTPGRRGHLRLDDAVSDVRLMTEEAAGRHGGLPVFLYGHSMGGNIALNYALRHDPAIRGLILSSPWLRLAFRPPAAQLWLGRRLMRYAPALRRPTGLRPEDLYRPGFMELEWDDPYVHKVITLATYFDLEEGGEWGLKEAERLRCPLLLFHGTGDRITSYKASDELASKLAGRCDYVRLEGGLHELHNDLEGERVINAVKAWLDKQL